MSKEVRAVTLYRASTKQQVGDNNDIPTQRKIVLDFIKKNNFKLVKEFTEGGVSGFKNTASERDKIQDIIEMAKNKEFDVLVIYHSNRLGRLADDTPLVVKQLNEYGVTVVSTVEGEISYKSHIDKFMTYFKYWTNEQDSITKSEVISDYHIAMVEEGRFRGGNFIPYGYKLVDNGNKNFKGRHILDFVIDEEEAKIVKLIFDLSIDKGYGHSRIAKYLNDLGVKTKTGKLWRNSTIYTILHNPIYKGQFRMKSKVRNKEVLSVTREDLIIIPPEKWDLEQLIAKNRSPKSKEKYEFVDKRSRTNYGKLLLNGIAFCGYCGEPLTTLTTYKKWVTKDGVNHKTAYHRYRCSSYYKGISCDGQSTYGRTRLEPVVIKEVKRFILDLQGRQLNEIFFENIKKSIKDKESQKEKIQKDISVFNKQLEALKEEVVKALIGESKFSEDILNELIEKKQEEINKAEKTLKNIQIEIKELENEMNNMKNFSEEIINWNDKFDNLDIEDQRRLLSEVLDKVVVYKDRIELNFDIRYEKFIENSSLTCENTNSVRARLVDLQVIKEDKVVPI